MMRFVRIVFWLTLVLWVGALMSGGVAAASVFSILPSLGVELDGYSQFPVDEHGRIAAGMIMEPVFTGIDVAQFVLAAIVIIAFVIELSLTSSRRWRTSNVLRVLALLIAAGTLVWRAAMIMPAMNQDLRAYRAAAEAGDTAEATSRRLEFDEAHPVAQRFMEATLVSLLVTAGATAAGVVPAVRRREESELEEPALLRRGAS